MEIREIIRALREDDDKKQKDIAAVIGVSQQTYGKYESGVYEIPNDVIVKLAEYYHVTTDYIMGLGDLRYCSEQLDERVFGSVTIGRLMAEILELDESAREKVVDYVNVQRLAQQVRKQRRKKVNQ